MNVLNLTVLKARFKPSQIFMISAMLVNIGNYLYNLALGRMLGPAAFADAAILITFLLILSFLAMTIQLSVAKFTGSFDSEKKDAFLKYARKISLIIGSGVGFLIFIAAGELQQWFQTDSSAMFRIFALGVPLYFLMSVNRGYYQGEQEFIKLSVTYQGEMLSRLFLTLGFIILLPFGTSELVAVGILLSLIPGMLPYKTTTRNSAPVLQKEDIAHLKHFVIVTALYELTQIVINNGDILLVKHFFDTRSAGLYSSMALIGRAVYFVAWMFVMLLLPEVVKLQKEGKDTKKLFFKYLGMIAALTTGVVIVNLLFPKLIVSILFGDAYLEIAPLLWKYALASSLFALANVFVYYFLSLDKYLPVLLSGVFGLAQLAAIVLWHSSLEQVVLVQVAIMCSLLLFQGLYFLYQVKSSAHRNQSPTRRRS